jgi:hypothetical protein
MTNPSKDPVLLAAFESPSEAPDNTLIAEA